MTTKVPVLRALPAGVTTVNRAELAPAGMVISRLLADAARTGQLTPPSVTELTGLRFWPESVTWLPACPWRGLKPLTLGRGELASTSKLWLLLTLPLGPPTVMGPSTASGGTSAMICEPLNTVKLRASWPPKRTTVLPRKPLPLIVTCVPGAPDVGVKPLTRNRVAGWIGPMGVGSGAGMTPPPMLAILAMIIFYG